MSPESAPAPPCLNLGIVAHVDAGKTSLTERLLYEAGVLDAPGSVDAGTTRTDSLDLERRRGITIRAAVTSFAVGDLDRQPLDTPGHPDFIAEVERSLGVLDAAVLVLSGRRGRAAADRRDLACAAPHRRADRALRQQGRPRGADVGRVLDQVRRRLTPYGRAARRRVTDEGTSRRRGRAGARSTDEHGGGGASPRPTTRCSPAGSRAGRSAPADVRRGAPPRRCGAATLSPVVCGSAITGAGVAELRDVAGRPAAPRAAGPGRTAAGTVFAVDRDEHGRRAWLRMWSGRVAGARPRRLRRRPPGARSPSSRSARRTAGGGPGRRGRPDRGGARAVGPDRRHPRASRPGARAPVRARRPCRRSSSRSTPAGGRRCSPGSPSSPTRTR